MITERDIPMEKQAESIRFSTQIQIGEDKVETVFEFNKGDLTLRAIIPKHDVDVINAVDAKTAELVEREYYFASLDCVNDENC